MDDSSEFRTVNEFLLAYKNGQRVFEDWDFNDADISVEGEDLSDAVFKYCFLFLNLRKCNLSGAQFISCNIKTADFRDANLTNAVIKDCSVESTMFKGALTEGLTFEENYCFGHTVGQSDFEELFKYSDE